MAFCDKDNGDGFLASVIWRFSGASVPYCGAGVGWARKAPPGPSALSVIAQEHQVIWLRLLGTIVVALRIEALELLGVVDPLLDHEAAHHPAGFLGIETDDLVPVSYTHLTLPTILLV